MWLVCDVQAAQHWTQPTSSLPHPPLAPCSVNVCLTPLTNSLLLFAACCYNHTCPSRHTPRHRTPAHCIEYAHLIKWSHERQEEEFDADNEEHMTWVYNNALTRAKQYGIEVRW